MAQYACVVVVRRTSYVDEVQSASFLQLGTLYEVLSTRMEYYGGVRMAEDGPTAVVPQYR